MSQAAQKAVSLLSRAHFLLNLTAHPFQASYGEVSYMDLRGIAKRTATPIASCILLLFLLFVYIPLVSANVQDETTAHAHLVTARSVQAPPTVDVTATMTALQEEKLRQEIQQLKNQNEPSITARFWNSSAAIATIVGALLAVFGVLATVRSNFKNELKDRQDARKKQAEERFKSIVEGLGSGSTETKLASTVLLRTFLNPDYKEFYTQVFDLAAASLRPRKHTDSSTSNQSSIDIAKPPDPLTQARITIFKEAFPLAREELKEELKKRESRFKPQFLDATDIQLDNAFLFGADLKEAWMPGAFLAKANLKTAHLDGINLQKACLINADLEQVILSEEAGLLANLDGANLTRARLSLAILTGASLRGANLHGADLTEADLSGADLSHADLSDAKVTREQLESTESLLGAVMPDSSILYFVSGPNRPNQEQLDILKQGMETWNQWRKEHPDIVPYLRGAYLRGADLSEADLRGADLSGGNFSGANLSEADLSGADLSGANLSGADLSKAHLSGAHLSRADLSKAHLSRAHLSGAILSEAILTKANLSEANLSEAILIKAILSEADLSKAKLSEADLSETDLRFARLTEAHLEGARLTKAHLEEAQLTGAHLEGAQFEGANLSGAHLERAILYRANPEAAESLQDTKMNGVIGLTPEQREGYIKKGAIFEETYSNDA